MRWVWAMRRTRRGSPTCCVRREESILRSLNREELPGCAQSLLIELAALKYLRTDSAGARKSASYTEGQLSQSESYYTSAEVLEGEAALLRTLAPYRRVACREGS